MNDQTNSSMLSFPADRAAGSLQRFAHEAMACTWGAWLVCDDAQYAAQAARALFEEVDRIEQELSRFIVHSDVARVNESEVGAAVQVGFELIECLDLAFRIHRETGGAFDVTVGALVSRAVGSGFDDPGGAESSVERTHVESEESHGPNHFPISNLGSIDIRGVSNGENSRGLKPAARDDGEGANAAFTEGASEAAFRRPKPEPSIGMDLLDIDRAKRTVARKSGTVMIDLGGLGKGYAIDQAALVLRDWRIDRAMIHAGRSTVFAMGAGPEGRGWGVGLRNPLLGGEVLARVELCDRALSGSGADLHEHHIIDPGTKKPATGPLAAWATAPTAAESDALSTAFMIATPDQVAAFCRMHQHIAAYTFMCDKAGGLVRCFGVEPSRGARPEPRL